MLVQKKGVSILVTQDSAGGTSETPWTRVSKHTSSHVTARASEQPLSKPLYLTRTVGQLRVFKVECVRIPPTHFDRGTYCKTTEAIPRLPQFV